MNLRQAVVGRDFESWRSASRAFLVEGVAPERIVWIDGGISQPVLPGLTIGSADLGESLIGTDGGAAFPVPARFIAIARLVACHRDDARWSRLYRVLWRLSAGERGLLDIVIDDDVAVLLAMEKAVRRDRHKMTAFVRFREVPTEAEPHYVAWYRPDHFIVRLTAPFFARRFATMRWSILTPDDCAHWDGSALTFSPGVPRSQAPDADGLESLWRTYYGSIFNPARVKIAAMKKEMPTRFWDVLPETQMIPDLLRDAPRRVQLMVARKPIDHGGAADYVPEHPTAESLRKAARKCQGCPLYAPATQTVFGEGPDDAKALVVGEQPGDQEDREGRPFVGPAGRLFDEALEKVGVDRSALYVTNAVKHFKFEPRGTRRIHSKPNAREITACFPWLEAEIQTIEPRLILCLGATAAQALLGRDFRMTRDRGTVFTDTKHAPWVMAMFHPSALLRIPDPQLKKEANEQFLADLRTFKAALEMAERK